MSAPTVAEAKQRLRIETADDDTMLTGMLEAATEVVLNYIKTPDFEWSDANAERVKSAIYLVVVVLYDGEPTDDPLGPTVKALLHSLRDPTLA